jgi:hypothetical protein
MSASIVFRHGDGSARSSLVDTARADDPHRKMCCYPVRLREAVVTDHDVLRPRQRLDPDECRNGAIGRWARREIQARIEKPSAPQPAVRSAAPATLRHAGAVAAVHRSSARPRIRDRPAGDSDPHDRATSGLDAPESNAPTYLWPRSPASCRNDAEAREDRAVLDVFKNSIGRLCERSVAEANRRLSPTSARGRRNDEGSERDARRPASSPDH